jgi:hypothetical protein
MPPRNARFGRDLVCDLDARNFGKPRAENTQVESFCRREFVDKVEGFGEAMHLHRTKLKPQWIWPEFTRPFGFPAGGQPLCQAASDDGKASTSPPSAWIVSPSVKQN